MDNLQKRQENTRIMPFNIENRQKLLQFVEECVINPIENGAVRITLYIDDRKNVVKSEEMIIRKR